MDGSMLKILLVVAVLVIGIVKEIKKSQAAKETTGKKRPVPPAASPETDRRPEPEIIALPESWRGMSLPEEALKPAEADASVRVGQPQQEDLTKRQTDSAAPERRIPLRPTPSSSRTSRKPSSPSQATPLSEDDFAIRSAEEARRAIIWGEILQRKY